MTTTFPGAVDAFPRPTSTTYTDDSGFELDLLIDNLSDALEAVESAVLKNARKNRVVNGDMRIKQRATLGSTDDTYTLDRHIVLMEAANACVVTQETSDVPSDGSKRAMKLTVGSGNNNKFGDLTLLEFADIADLRGKVVSIQLKLKATAGLSDVRVALIEWASTADSVTSDVISSWGSAGTNPTLATNWAYCSGYTSVSLAPTTSWATYKVEGQYTVGASANNLGLFVWCDDKTTTQTTDYFLLTDVQLEEGPVCTNVERRPRASELALCEYWLQAFGGTAASFASMGSATSTTLADFGPIIKRTMRAAPTLSYTAADWSVADLGVQVVTTNIAIIFAHNNALWLRATVAAGLTAGRAVGLSNLLGAGFTPLLFSAEL